MTWDQFTKWIIRKSYNFPNHQIIAAREHLRMLIGVLVFLRTSYLLSTTSVIMCTICTQELTSSWIFQDCLKLLLKFWFWIFGYMQVKKCKLYREQGEGDLHNQQLWFSQHSGAWLQNATWNSWEPLSPKFKQDGEEFWAGNLHYRSSSLLL